MTGNNKVLFIVLGVIVLGMGGATIWKMDSSQTPSVMATVAPAQDLPAMDAGMSGEHRQRPEIHQRPSGSNTKPPSREQLAAMRKDRTAKAARAYDLAGEQFASQRVDPVWSAKTEQSLQKLNDNPAFAQIGAQPKDLQIDCKSSLCQIKGQFASDREARDWTQIYMTNVGSLASMGRVRFYPNPDGSTQVRIYSYK